MTSKLDGTRNSPTYFAPVQNYQNLQPEDEAPKDYKAIFTSIATQIDSFNTPNSSSDEESNEFNVELREARTFREIETHNFAGGVLLEGNFKQREQTALEMLVSHSLISREFLLPLCHELVYGLHDNFSEDQLNAFVEGVLLKLGVQKEAIRYWQNELQPGICGGCDIIFFIPLIQDKNFFEKKADGFPNGIISYCLALSRLKNESGESLLLQDDISSMTYVELHDNLRLGTLQRLAELAGIEEAELQSLDEEEGRAYKLSLSLIKEGEKNRCFLTMGQTQRLAKLAVMDETESQLDQRTYKLLVSLIRKNGEENGRFLPFGLQTCLIKQFPFDRLLQFSLEEHAAILKSDLKSEKCNKIHFSKLFSKSDLFYIFWPFFLAHLGAIGVKQEVIAKWKELLAPSNFDPFEQMFSFVTYTRALASLPYMLEKEFFEEDLQKEEHPVIRFLIRALDIEDEEGNSPLVPKGIEQMFEYQFDVTHRTMLILFLMSPKWWGEMERVFSNRLASLQLSGEELQKCLECLAYVAKEMPNLWFELYYSSPYLTPNDKERLDFSGDKEKLLRSLLITLLQKFSTFKSLERTQKSEKSELLSLPSEDLIKNLNYKVSRYTSTDWTVHGMKRPSLL